MDAVIYNAAISACEKAGQWVKSLELLSEMAQEKLDISVVTCNAAISACGKCGEWIKALKLLDTMAQLKLKQNTISYSAAISACDSQASWAWALHLVEVMSTSGMVVSGLNFGSAISALKKFQHWDRAFMLFDEARVIWTTVYDAPCGKSGLPLALDHIQNRADTGETSSRLGETNVVGTESSHHISSADVVDILALGPGLVAVSKQPGVKTEVILKKLQRQLRATGQAEHITCISRLDLSTSGVLMAALGPEHSAAAQLAMAQFAGRIVDKEYVCLCVGEPLGPAGTTGSISVPLQVVQPVRDAHRVIASTAGKEAITSYQVVATCPFDSYKGLHSEMRVAQSLSLLVVRPQTGRQHQIRVHVASIRRPIVADAAYSSHAIGWCPRMFLHCRRVKLYDLTGNGFSAEPPLPDDLAPALAFLVDVCNGRLAANSKS